MVIAIAALTLILQTEVRCRHATLLNKLGHHAQAQAALDALIEHTRRHRVSHEAELTWLDRARQELRSN